jgi:enterochelin esterase-like enzyme
MVERGRIRGIGRAIFWKCPVGFLFGRLCQFLVVIRDVDAVPVQVAISIGNGSGDAQGSERGLEYDTMSGRYAEFVETEVLPLVEAQAHVELTHDPDARAAMGGGSGDSCALIMAWYHPEWYHRVLTYSGTYVNQEWPCNPQAPHGAWGFHEHSIPNGPTKPIRIWMEVGDQDLLNPNSLDDI